MRLLANENFPAIAVEALRQAGHDTMWIRTEAPGISDDAVMARALSDGRLLLTFDKDFGELVFYRGQQASNGIVLFRIPMTSPTEVARRVVSVLASRPGWENHFSVVASGKIRMRPLPKSV